jgi:hypothetical protein
MRSKSLIDIEGRSRISQGNRLKNISDLREILTYDYGGV